MRRILVLLALLSARPALAQCGGEEGPVAPLASAVAQAAGRGPVPLEAQRAALDEILRRVETTPRAVVQIDLDNTSFEPRHGTELALAEVAAKYGIPELADPASLPAYPEYPAAAFEHFLDLTGLRARHSIDWKALEDDYTAAVRVHRDEEAIVTPGLAAFVEAVRARGGEVVFNTGRLERFRRVSEATLERGGVRNPVVVLKPESFEGSIPEAKAAAQAAIARYGTTVAIVDDMEENRDAVTSAVPGALAVAIALPGFVTEKSDGELARLPWKISTFER